MHWNELKEESKQNPKQLQFDPHDLDDVQYFIDSPQLASISAHG